MPILLTLTLNFNFTACSLHDIYRTHTLNIKDADNLQGYSSMTMFLKRINTCYMKISTKFVLPVLKLRYRKHT